MPQKGIQGNQIEETTLDLTGVDGSGLINLPAGGVFVETSASDFGLANGSSNIIGGLYAGSALTAGNNNFIAGHNAGQYATDITASILIGTNAGRFLGIDDSNIVIGSHAAGSTHTIGQSNVVIGGGAGISLSGTTARFNVFIGTFVAADAVGGVCSNNVAIGNQALQNITSGGGNVVIGGSFAAAKLITGGGNICIGNSAGPTAIDTSYKLFIDPLETDTPLIGGDFLASTVDIEGELTVSGNSISHIAINIQGGDYTLVLTDDGKIISMNVITTANNLTVPPNSSVAFPVGTQILVEQEGTGITTIVAGTGVTLNSAGGLLSTASQYSTLSLIKKAVDTWTVAGDLA